MNVDFARSVTAFGEEEWNRLFPGELENWAYHKAVELAALPGFEWVYFRVRHHGELCAVVPAFVTDYRIDTTLEGALQRIADRIARWFPRLLSVRLLSLGSPVSECCHVGLPSTATPALCARLLARLLSAAEDYARRQGLGMLAVKDAGANRDDLWQATCSAQGLRALPGLPTATLRLPFTTVQQYLQSLSSATRKDLRRKLKAAADIRIEWRRDIRDILPRLMDLYGQTLSRSAMRFEELTPAYFENVLLHMPDSASCVTYWRGDLLVAFNLVLHDEQRFTDKYLGMDYRFARSCNLYFVSWIENVRYCIEHGIGVYQSGQAVYHDKLRLGSQLTTNWLWYRHRNPVVDALFAAIERRFGLDRADPEIAELLREHGA